MKYVLVDYASTILRAFSDLIIPLHIKQCSYVVSYICDAVGNLLLLY